MIFIKKPSTPPTILTTDGAQETKDLNDAYSRDSIAYQRGTKTFVFKRDIYSDETVRNALVSAQHGKCAFCESKITHDQPGDVEHFRPKAGFVRGKKLVRPGYYWLAYEWDNLLLACALCNRRHKRNAFPLLNGSRRARSHLDSVTAERPAFIHPAKEDPEPFIGFRTHVPYARKKNARGRRTIQELGLKRQALADMRADHLNWIKAVKKLVRICPPGRDRAEAEALLLRAQQPDQEFSSMVRSFLASI